MRIDRSHRPWALFTIAALVAAAICYWHYITRGAGRSIGPRGSSWPGLTFGIIGTVLIAFAALLTPRKKVRTWRVGRAETWMRGHLWLGLLSLPMILFHAGFRAGGPLTSLLLLLLIVIVVSGFMGALFQHWVPKTMTRDVLDETIYEQIPQVLRYLRAEAEDAVVVCGPLDGEQVLGWREERAATLKARGARETLTPERRDQLLALVAAAPMEGTAPLKDFYTRHVVGYLADDAPASSTLNDPISATALFQQQRLRLPQPLHGSLVELQRICDQRRQFLRQRRLHHLLHLWLYLHVPLSFAMVILALWHIVASLRYVSH